MAFRYYSRYWDYFYEKYINKAYSGFKYYNDYYNYIIGMSVVGQLGKAFVYYKWRGKQRRRKYFIPPYTNSDYQERHRQLFADAVHLWKNLSQLEKKNLDLKNPKYRVQSGYNFFISSYLKKWL